MWYYKPHENTSSEASVWAFSALHACTACAECCKPGVGSSAAVQQQHHVTCETAAAWLQGPPRHEHSARAFTPHLLNVSQNQESIGLSAAEAQLGGPPKESSAIVPPTEWPRATMLLSAMACAAEEPAASQQAVNMGEGHPAPSGAVLHFRLHAAQHANIPTCIACMLRLRTRCTLHMHG